MQINPRILAFMALIGICGLVVYGGGFLFPNSNKSDLPQPTMVVIHEPYEVLVTPTPDGHIYFASEYQNGTRQLKRPYSFIRYNALYKMDMKVTTIVYDYDMFEVLHWYNPSMAKYYEQKPSEGMKWCFIYLYIVMDNIAGDDTRMWLFNRTEFVLYDEKIGYTSTIRTYPYQLRYREIENKPTFDNSMYIQAFKSKRMYSSNLDYAGSAGEMYEEQYYLRGGESNAMDGYLLYEIPIDSQPENLLVLANLHAFGNSQWRLKV